MALSKLSPGGEADIPRYDPNQPITRFLKLGILKRPSLSSSGISFDLPKVEEIYERARAQLEAAPPDRRPALEAALIELCDQKAARDREVMDAHLKCRREEACVRPKRLVDLRARWSLTAAKPARA
jgi:hypothetical protein